MSLGTILLIILILVLLGVLPTWGHSRSWGYGPSGIVGSGETEPEGWLAAEAVEARTEQPAAIPAAVRGGSSTCRWAGTRR